MKHNYAKGIHPKRAHTSIPEGTYEEELGRDGFFGDQVQFYRLHPNTAWSRIEGPLQPHSIQSYDLVPDDLNDPNAGPVRILYNEDVRISVSRRRETMPYFFRNGDGDELHFIHKGEGRFESDFGAMRFEVGDYILIPKGTNYRFVYETDDNYSLITESKHAIGFPDRGLIGHHAPFDYTCLETPEPDPVYESDQEEWEVRIKKHDQYTSIFYPFCPMDVVGWAGTLSVIKLNVRDIANLMSDGSHLPPSAHCSFVAKGLYVCTFRPRPMETDPRVERVPWGHRNIDCDEVFFIHDGVFTLSRNADDKGASTGSISLNPAGLQHGSEPGVLERAKQNWQEHARIEATALNIDVELPLTMTEAAKDVEIPDFYKNWIPKEPLKSAAE